MCEKRQAQECVEAGRGEEVGGRGKGGKGGGVEVGEGVGVQRWERGWMCRGGRGCGCAEVGEGVGVQRWEGGCAFRGGRVCRVCRGGWVYGVCRGGCVECAEVGGVWNV